MRYLALTILFLAIGGAAGAQADPPLTGRDVAVRMTDPQPQRFFPEAALRGNVQGSASVLCSITSDGALSDCVLASETPVGKGFAEAVGKIAGFVRIAPTAKDGSATAGRKYLFVMKFGVR